MLSRLYIKNVAIISELELSFPGSMNILTGETGAGKSILLGAIGLLLGERASSDLIRTGSDRALVEGTFTIGDPAWLKTLLQSEEIDTTPPDLVIRREITSRGQNRIFINDQVVSLNLLRSIGDRLVDLHGQHDHQSLLNQDLQKQFLDDFCGNSALLDEFKSVWTEWDHSNRTLAKLKKERQSLLEKQELSAFQLKEIDDAGVHAGEDSDLEQELNRLDHAGFLFQTSGAVAWSLTGDEAQNLHAQLTDVLKKLEELVRIDPALAEYQKELQSASISIKETGRFFAQYADRVVVDPERQVAVRNRLDLINRLKKKYGPTLTEVLDLRERLAGELAGDLNVDGRIAAMETMADELKAKTEKLASGLSDRRSKGAVRLARSVIDQLTGLGLEKCRFEIRVTSETDPGSPFQKAGTPVKMNQDGWDQVVFLISTNAGEELKPLSKVASGGEISRIMLAIKAATAEAAGVNVLIFDEIDTGVSGKIASAVGKVLTQLSVNRQIFVITHLPQVASIPGDHYQVRKSVQNGSTESTVIQLGQQERIEEIARLLSGESVTDRSRAQAADLLGLA